MQPTARERPALRFPDLNGQPSQVDPAAFAEALDRIRDRVHDWLDRIEALAGEAGADNRALEQQRIALQDEIELHQRQWESRVEELDHDRRLLAEAWERLEREQQAVNMASGPAAERPRADRRAEAPPPLQPPAPAPSPSSEADGVVDRAILRQFEALRRDVRRTAESRSSSAP